MFAFQKLTDSRVGHSWVSKLTKGIACLQNVFMWTDKKLLTSFLREMLWEKGREESCSPYFQICICSYTYFLHGITTWIVHHHLKWKTFKNQVYYLLSKCISSLLSIILLLSQYPSLKCQSNFWNSSFFRLPLNYQLFPLTFSSSFQHCHYYSHHLTSCLDYAMLD